MIAVDKFYNILQSNDIDFFSGVPDSLLKSFCAYISENVPTNKHIISANEGGAIALAAGYYLATNKVPLVYMQNSGLGNATNPLLSLADKEVYAIPMLLMIGWRGEPYVKDEPQHIKQGRITPALLDAMEIPYYIIDKDTDFNKILLNCINKVKDISAPVALLIKKDTFAPYTFITEQTTNSKHSRESALEIVINHVPKDVVIVSTTGMLSRELFELREKIQATHATDFLTVGSMGHAVQIALGIALGAPHKKVFCLDGDGAALMHLGNYAIVGDVLPQNLNIILFNNGAHDSVGGQPTIAQKIDFQKLTQAFNLNYVGRAETAEQIIDYVKFMCTHTYTNFIEIIVKKGARKNLGRPTTTTLENKNSIQKYIQS